MSKNKLYIPISTRFDYKGTPAFTLIRLDKLKEVTSVLPDKVTLTNHMITQGILYKKVKEQKQTSPEYNPYRCEVSQEKFDAILKEIRTKAKPARKPTSFDIVFDLKQLPIIQITIKQ